MTRVESERQYNRIPSESDSDIEITKYVPKLSETVNNQPVKFIVQDNISSDDWSDRPSNGPYSNSQSSSIQSNTSKLIKPVNWLAWCVTRKEHIFRAFKHKNIPESNLAEVAHSAWVTQKEDSSLCLNQRLTIFVI